MSEQQIETTAPDLTAEEARALTDRIKTAADNLWSLLLEAHEHRAWAALGYARWEDYITTEFGMHRRTSYKLLDQGRVIREINKAVGDVPHGAHDLVVLSGREARDIKPVLSEVTQQIQDRVAELGDLAPPPDQVQQIVREVVDEQRAKAQEARDLRESVDNFNRATAHLVPQADAERPWGLMAVAITRALDALPLDTDPRELARNLPTHTLYRLHRVPEAILWLQTLMDERTTAS